MNGELNRRRFIEHAAVIGGVLGCRPAAVEARDSDGLDRLRPIGLARGVHPGRVVWVHDPDVTDWAGPGEGHWYDPQHLSQDRVSAMMEQAVCQLAGESSVGAAWKALFRHFNQGRGRADTEYRAGEKLAIKPNWVGMIWREGNVDLETYRLIRRQDYMNTAPQMLIALIDQLVSAAGVAPADITVCDTLAYMAEEYYRPMRDAFPDVAYEDFGGQAGRRPVRASSVPFYWSCRPEGVATDYVPESFARADYLINFANLKAHTGAGVTLCAKNHFGSLVRWPVQAGYYNMHRHCFTKKTAVYRENVDLLGHAQLGGKTVLNLIDGLFPGKHPIDHAPRRWDSPPFDGHWACSLLASQDPVAIDSVGFDFLWSEWSDHPRNPGADDYLHEAALAHDPPSGTFYDPNHPTDQQRLASLGVHEHWNNARDRQYSRNLEAGEGIELVAVRSG